MNILDKLINNIRFDKKYVLFSLIIIVLGITTGSLFIVILNSSDKSLVIEYITSFIDNINNISNLDTLKNTLITNYLTIFILLIIGYSCFLFPINILILFYKAFILGFSLASFILTYGLKGIMLSLLYVFPHLIINLIIFCLISSFTLRISITMIGYIIKRKEINARIYFNKFLSLIIIGFIIIGLTSLYEAYALPYLFKFVTKLL